MKTRVIVGQRVKDFLETLAPEPRRKLWHGLKGLAQDKGDLKQLEGKLAPYWRLRVDRLRVIYEPRSVASGRCFVSSRITGPRSMSCWSNCSRRVWWPN